MSMTSMNTGSLESGLYTARFDDGLLDLCCGIGLLGTGLLWLVDQVALAAAAPALLIPVWLELRRRITEPRVGRVEFSPPRRRRERTGLLSALGVGTGVLAFVGAVVFWRRGGAPDPGSWVALVPLLPGFLVGLGLIVVGVLIGARRFVGYAAALMALAALVTSLGGEPGLYLALAGALLCLWAGGVVARFVTSHPILERE